MADSDYAALCRQMAIARQRRIDSEAEEALLQAQIAAAGRPRRFANEPNVEDLVVPLPPDPLVVQEYLARNAVVSVLSTPVSRFGLDPVLLDGYFNFDQQDMVKIVANKGVFIVTSMPQSDKTCCLGAGIAAQQKVVSRPQILMSADVAMNIAELQAKLDFTETFGVKFIVIKSEVQIAALKRDMYAFMTGRLVPIVQSLGAQLARVKNFLVENNVRDVTVWSDEPDAMWTNHPESETYTNREAELRDFLGMSPAGFMGDDCMVRKFVMVSATHMSDIHILDILGANPVQIRANPEKLAARGYADTDEILPCGAWLDPATHNKEHMYCMESPDVEDFLADFAADPRPWKFLMVCTTPFVSVDSGSFEVAGYLAQKYPEFYTVVKSAAGIRRFRSYDGDIMDFDMGSSLQKVVNELDARPGGKDVPFVEVTYSMSMRGSSDRGDVRVPTHMICALTAGRSTAEIMQIFMRGGGRSVMQRRANGYPGVKLLTIESDYRVFKGLDDLTVAAAARMPDFTAGEYPHEMREVVGCKRPHCRKKLKMDFKRARYATPNLEPPPVFAIAPVAEPPGTTVAEPLALQQAPIQNVSTRAMVIARNKGDRKALLSGIYELAQGRLDVVVTSQQMKAVPALLDIISRSKSNALAGLVTNGHVLSVKDPANPRRRTGEYTLTEAGRQKVRGEL
jgi:hypothetical protein